MCGISGVLAFRNSNFNVTAEYLVRMRDTMAHRGPDGAGLWISSDGHVGLGIGGFPSSIFPTLLLSP